MISQFVEIPHDMVFTEEYSVRAARTAVYKLLGIKMDVEPVTTYNKQPEVLAKAVILPIGKLNKTRWLLKNS